MHITQRKCDDNVIIHTFILNKTENNFHYYLKIIFHYIISESFDLK